MSPIKFYRILSLIHIYHLTLSLFNITLKLLLLTLLTVSIMKNKMIDEKTPT